MCKRKEMIISVKKKKSYFKPVSFTLVKFFYQENFILVFDFYSMLGTW